MTKRRISKKPKQNKVLQKQSQSVVVHINNGSKNKKRQPKKDRPAHPRDGVSSYQPHIVSRPIVEMYAPQNFYNPNQQGNPLIPISSPIPVSEVFNKNENDNILDYVKNKTKDHLDKTFGIDEIYDYDDNPILKPKQIQRPNTGIGTGVGHLAEEVATNARERDKRRAGGGGLTENTKFKTIQNLSEEERQNYFSKYPFREKNYNSYLNS